MNDRPVFYVARIVPGYRLAVLERLNERLNGRLVVCSGQPPKNSSLGSLVLDEEASIKRVALRNWWLFDEKLHAQGFRKVFHEFGDPTVVLAEESPRSISLPFLLRYARKRGAGRALWGHFSSFNRTFNPDKHLQDRYRLALARHVEACACYTQGIADMLSPYVADEKLYVARNTFDIAPMLAQHEQLLASEGKASVRRRLGLPANGPIIVFIGRLVREKGTSMLLETYARLAAASNGALLIIGDGPERSTMESRIRSESLKGIHFLGPLFNEDAAPYLFASDVMCMPGYLGLVINHAFAFGLPVVSFRKPTGTKAHSPEVEYVQSGENGLLVEGETAGDLHAGLMSVLADLPRYSKNASTYAREYLTVEHMVDGLYDAIQHAEESVR